MKYYKNVILVTGGDLCSFAESKLGIHGNHVSNLLRDDSFNENKTVCLDFCDEDSGIIWSQELKDILRKFFEYYNLDEFEYTLG